mgnify:CR=1 FL=1
MIHILSDNKEYYYIPKDIMRIILSFLTNMNEVNANQWCTEENILFNNEKLRYGYLSFYLSLSNKDFTKHQPFDDEYFESEYRLCGIKLEFKHHFDLESDFDLEQDYLEQDYLEQDYLEVQEEEDTVEPELW